MIKVALYLRSSKEKHDVSVDSHRREIRELVENEGEIVVAEYVDKAESAKTDKRRGFQSMMSDIRNNHGFFSKIYCYDTGRFSRRQHHASKYKHELRQLGVEMVYLKIPQKGMALSMRTMAVGVSETFDTYFSEKSKEDGLRGMRENILNGYRAGGRALFGYKLQYEQTAVNKHGPVFKSRYVPDPGKFELARQYLRGRLRGEVRSMLVERLGLKISTARLIYMEKSALLYAGHLIWNRNNERVDGKYVGGKRERQPEDWVVVPNSHQAAITENEANQILASFKKRQTGRRMRVSGYVLSGLLKCRCGANMDGDDGYYRCHHRCKAKKIKKEHIENVVLDGVLNDVLTPGAMRKILKEILRKANGLKDTEQARGEISRQIADIRAQQDKLTHTLIEFEHKRPIIEKIEELEEIRVALESKLANIHQRQAEAMWESQSQFGKFLAEHREGLTDVQPMTRKATLRAVLGKCVFAHDDLVSVYPALETSGGFKMAFPRGLYLKPCK